MKVLVTGGTGFVGSRVVHALRAQDRDVRVLVRRPERAAQLAGWGAELATGDITDPATLTAALAGCTHVVHLVAILSGSRADFERVMTQGTKDLLAAAKAEGVEQFILMSALGTSEASKDSVPYFAAKWNEEQAVLASDLQHTIFRPSFVFGRGGALPLFVKQVRYSPVVTVIGDGLQRSQPIWIEDVAAIFAQAVGNPRAANRTFELGGPDTVTWNELYLTIARVLGKRRRLAHVPFGLARLGARVTQVLPKAPLTTDQVTMLQGADNVVSNTDAVDTFKLPLLGLEEQIRRSI
ncbi:MAG: complex I NDUFA9 subunit family protein [Gaiellaceae bacterium]